MNRGRARLPTANARTPVALVDKTKREQALSTVLSTTRYPLTSGETYVHSRGDVDIRVASASQNALVAQSVASRASKKRGEIARGTCSYVCTSERARERAIGRADLREYSSRVSNAKRLFDALSPLLFSRKVIRARRRVT